MTDILAEIAFRFTVHNIVSGLGAPLSDTDDQKYVQARGYQAPVFWDSMRRI